MPFTNAPTLDDILIFSKRREEHISHVQAVLQCLLQHSLFIKAEKCQFHAESVSFLGFIMGKGNIQMDPMTVSAAANWPVPESWKQLQRFLGFANFYLRFIRACSVVVAPLTALMSNLVPNSYPPGSGSRTSVCGGGGCGGRGLCCRSGWLPIRS